MRPCLEFLVIWGLSNDHRFFKNKQALHIGMYSTCGSDIDILYCYNSSTCQASWKLREAWDLVTKSHLKPVCLLTTKQSP